MIDLAITADHIRSVIDDYLDTYPEEKHGLGPVLELLDDGADLTPRKEFRGHVTAGAILAGPDGRILHINHLALGKWLLPGGHLEASDVTLLDAALRELVEETGIPARTVIPVDDRPVQIDIHRIPANDAKGEPAHQHFDFRFLFRSAADVGRLQTEEVTDSAWRDAGDISDRTLRQRVAQALR
ncbi:8-oxo-dGTP pyrophosphatase MutT, NUDIX family [Streptosporangium canum]|uniref:8-oxo-dGTP pyrophosphatase MutT, NUDIX family n=1 Tax=Streptosporangium canum TaxID=324952 RepID=A0A1I4BIZ4_9ACTN|nr:NUDIX domain-containing protein [Streptosporangium canum]SFK68473.1 8-oxo-dGTP pyrophosphatase MutT, NUDIX family [Streptosporangium canum]